jgi:CheY-like chemotaxis protein
LVLVRLGEENKMGNPRILIADDSITLSRFLGVTFEQICPACQIIIVSDGLAALAAVQRSSTSPTFDLIFTDYEMPGMNGLELARAVYDSQPDIKVVLMTGHSYVPGLNGPRRPINLIGVLNKPFSPKQIEETFAAIFGHVLNGARELKG